MIVLFSLSLSVHTYVGTYICEHIRMYILVYIMCIIMCASVYSNMHVSYLCTDLIVLSNALYYCIVTAHIKGTYVATVQCSVY